MHLLYIQQSSRIHITQVMYLVRSIEMFAVQFVTISNTYHRHPVAMMRQEDMPSLWEYAQFCMEFAGNDESPVSHGPAKCLKR